MDKTQKIVVALLVVAVLFSVGSIVLNLTVVGLEPLEISSIDARHAVQDSSDGNVNLVVQPSGGSG
jgi:hypothetical protein